MLGRVNSFLGIDMGWNLPTSFLVCDKCLQSSEFLSFWQPVSNLSLSFHTMFSLCVSTFYSIQGTVHWIRTDSCPMWPHLNLITLIETLFLYELTFMYNQGLELECICFQLRSSTLMLSKTKAPLWKWLAPGPGQGRYEMILICLVMLEMKCSKKTLLWGAIFVA